jgi:nucleoid DNA-binding protein
MAQAVTKTELIKMMADAGDTTTANIKALLEIQHHVIMRVLKRAKPGERVPVIAGLSLYKHKVKATKARRGINPFTRQPMTFKAKPAHTKIKASIGKAIKG